MNRAAKIQLLKDLREGRKSLADFTMQQIYISGFDEDSEEHKEFVDLCLRSDAVFMPVFPDSNNPRFEYLKLPHNDK